MGASQTIRGMFRGSSLRSRILCTIMRAKRTGRGPHPMASPPKARGGGSRAGPRGGFGGAERVLGHPRPIPACPEAQRAELPIAASCDSCHTGGRPRDCRPEAPPWRGCEGPRWETLRVFGGAERDLGHPGPCGACPEAPRAESKIPSNFNRAKFWVSQGVAAGTTPRGAGRAP